MLFKTWQDSHEGFIDLQTPGVLLRLDVPITGCDAIFPSVWIRILV